MEAHADLAATREAVGDLVGSEHAARRTVEHAEQVTHPRPDTVRALWRAASLLRDRGADDWQQIEATGRTWLDQHGTGARHWLVPRAMAARHQGATAAAAGNHTEAETQFRRALGLYARAAWWPPGAFGVVWPQRTLVWHDLAGIQAHRNDPQTAIRLSEREVMPILRAMARLRPGAWLRSYTAVTVDVAEWAYRAGDPLLSTYLTRAATAANQTLTHTPQTASAEDLRCLLRIRTIETYVLEDQRTNTDADTLAATDREYATTVAAVADLHTQIAQHTDAPTDWGPAAELAGIAYRQYRRIGDASTSAQYLRTAIQNGERYILQAPEPQTRTIERLADWLLAATDHDPDIAGDHAAIVQHLQRAADLYERLPRTYRTAAHTAGLLALVTEQHHSQSNKYYRAAETAETGRQPDLAEDMRKASADEFVAAAKAGHHAIDLYGEAHHLVEIDDDVTDADQQRADWIELELDLCERLPEIGEELVRIGIAGAEERLSEIYQRGVAVARMAWQLLPDRRPVIAPICSHLLRQQARHLLVTADRDPTAYGRALDHATEAIDLDQAYPHQAGPRRPELLAIAYGLVAASRLGDTLTTKTLLDRWDQVYDGMMAAGRRHDATEVVRYLHRRVPELADRLPDVPAPPATKNK